MNFPHRALEQIRGFLEQADPELVTTCAAAELVRSFSELGRLADAGKLLFANRAAESLIWAEGGHRSPASWLAETSGSSVGEAISSLETATRLEDLERTKDALRRGELSFEQVREVSSAAEKDRSKENELIKAASTETLKSLKARARKIRLRGSSAKEECERYRQIHASRYCRTWNDEDGALRLDARFTPDQGARLLSSLDKETNLFFEEARAERREEQTQAYRADALCALVTGEGRSRPGSHRTKELSPGSKASCGSRTDTLVLRVDATALRRGHAKGQELCEIPGVGPVPVATARRVLGEAYLKVVIRDSVDVLSVCHLGRAVPSHLQSALEERDPTCVVCDSTYGLENHHWKEDFASCKTTSLEGLARVCKHHHDLITYDDYKLVGGPGAWKLVPPPSPKILDTS